MWTFLPHTGHYSLVQGFWSLRWYISWYIIFSQLLTVWFNQRLRLSLIFLPPQIINGRRVASRPLGVNCACGVVSPPWNWQKVSLQPQTTQFRAQSHIASPSSSVRTVNKLELTRSEKYTKGAFKLTTANRYVPDTILNKPVLTFYTASHYDKQISYMVPLKFKQIIG